MNNSNTLLAAFHNHLTSQQTAPNTLRSYLGDMKAFIAWFERSNSEKFEPSSTVRRDIQEWRDFLLTTSKPISVNRKLSSLRIFFEWAERKGLTTSDPTRRVHGVKFANNPPHTPSDASVEKILRAARTQGSPRDRSLLELLASTGLRVAELIGLHRSDLELGEASAWLNIPAGKGCQARRIPLNVRTRMALREYLVTEESMPADGSLFMNRFRKAMTPYSIWYTVRKYTTLADEEGITPRSLRNAVVAKLSRNPHVSLVAAAAFLGQKRLDALAHFFQRDDLQTLDGQE
jgi:integrase/recombinase XerD